MDEETKQTSENSGGAGAFIGTIIILIVIIAGAIYLVLNGG
jgi:hypothetical protein